MAKSPESPTSDASPPDAPNPNWQDFADRLNALSDELMAAADALADDMDNQIVQLQAVTLRHYAHHVREFAHRAD